eukprot:11167867-Lingulodinium_polyedra.AAC.1
MHAFHARCSATATHATHAFHTSGKWPTLVRGSASKLAAAGSTGNQHWQQQQQQEQRQRRCRRYEPSYWHERDASAFLALVCRRP